METQDAAATFIYKLWPQFEANKNKILAVAAIVVVLVAVVSFISWHREQNQIAAGDALTQSLVTLPPNAPPSQMAQNYLSVANDYPNTLAGARSLLQGAATLFTEGDYTHAQAYFQQFLDAHPDDDLSGVAALGVAKCLEAEGKLNQAAGQYQHVIDDFSDAESVINAKFSLARLDMRGHNYADAARLFQDVAQTDPYGALGNEALQYVFELRSKIPQAPATTPNSSFNLSH